MSSRLTPADQALARIRVDLAKRFHKDVDPRVQEIAKAKLPLPTSPRHGEWKAPKPFKAKIAKAFGKRSGKKVTLQVYRDGHSSPDAVLVILDAGRKVTHKHDHKGRFTPKRNVTVVRPRTAPTHSGPPD